MSIADTLKELLSKTGVYKAVGGSSSESVIGIDIGSASIKIVQLRREGGRAILETYGAITLGPYANTEAGRVTKLGAPEIGTALTDLIREANVTAKLAAVAIPFSSSLTSVIKMPRMSEDQLNKMVPLEARKYIPIPINDVMLDWFVIPEDEAPERASTIKNVSTPLKSKEVSAANTLEVLLVAIHNTTLQMYQAVMQASSMNVQFYELEIFSAARSALGHGIAPVAIVDIGASSSKIYIVERGIVRISHLINKGSQDITLQLTRALNIPFMKAERLKKEVGLQAHNKTGSDNDDTQVAEAMLSTLDYIFGEVNRVLLRYGKQYNKNISRVVLCGGTSVMNGLHEYAETKIDSPVEIADSFSRIQAPAFLTDVLKEVGPEFTVATGLALRHLYMNN